VVDTSRSAPLPTGPFDMPAIPVKKGVALCPSAVMLCAVAVIGAALPELPAPE